MAQNISHQSSQISPEEGLRLLAEAWAYYTPTPRLVTERSGQPSPAIEEYYAA